jgi:hypothetical protein
MCCGFLVPFLAEVMTALDWQGASGVLALSSSANVDLRNLVLMNGGSARPGLYPAYAQNLTLYQWPLDYSRTRQALTMENVTVVVPGRVGGRVGNWWEQACVCGGGGVGGQAGWGGVKTCMGG